MAPRTFVIGDVHGHHDRLVDLLTKIGTLFHQVPEQLLQEIEIVQLGDLGHYGYDTEEGDYDSCLLARECGIIPLWGNHDYAVVETEKHRFAGYMEPEEFPHLERKFAHAAHGYLITHAGLGYEWGKNLSEMGIKTAEQIAEWLNNPANENTKVINAIGKLRGGLAHHGGILWRDDREKIWSDVPQVYGHTRGDIRRFDHCWCIDVGDRYDSNLAGIWLPDRTVVAIGPEADIYEEMGRQLRQGL